MSLEELRDEFAGKAMQAELTRWDHDDFRNYPEDTQAAIAKRAYAFADAMLKQRASVVKP